jgi:hypothetical protein
LEDSRELVQREADSERAPDQANALAGVRRILPVAGCGSLGAGQDADPLIMAERVGADTAFPREFAGSHVLVSIDPGTGSGVKGYFQTPRTAQQPCLLRE